MAGPPFFRGGFLCVERSFLRRATVGLRGAFAHAVFVAHGGRFPSAD